MINGVHALIYSKDVDAARAFFRDVLRFPFVDAGEGWLIFALPPAELGIHPSRKGARHELHLMCDDVKTTVNEMKRKGIEFTQPIKDAGYGLVTSLKIPGGGEMGLYEPRRPRPSKRKG